MKKSTSWIFKTLFILAVVGTVLGSAVVGGLFYYFSRDLPEIISLKDYRPLVVTRVLADNGKEDSVIGEFYKERRYLTPYDKFPDLVVKAFVSAEDDQFFQHQGVNFGSILRAAIANFRAGQVVQGGSTITQQVAKSLLLTPERHFSRKFKELILAHQIERRLSKQDILYLYLNQIYLGHGAYGVQAAARTYYRKNVKDVNLAEAAIIAGMPTAPGKYSPNQNPKAAKQRQLYVLRRMYENGYITQKQMQEAAAEPVHIFNDEDITRDVGGHYVEYLRRQLMEKYGEKALFEDGLTISVPMSLDAMRAARKALRDGLRAVDKRVGYRGPIRELASDKEIEAELVKERLAMIDRKLKYRVLLPDGKLEAGEAAKRAGIQADWQLLSPGDVYEAVVSSVDDKRKVASVLIGTARAEIPMSKMSWAKAVRDDKHPDWKPEPTIPSKVVKRGDVIEVGIVEASEKGVVASLEQEPEIEGALFSLDTRNGNVLAMEGGYDFKRSQYNRVEQAKRQPGSAFKPLIYASALTKGFTPASIIVDSPIVYQDTEDNAKWKPANDGGKFYGDTTFRQALIKSRNVPTIKIVQAIQVPFVIDFVKNLGLSGPFNADLSISLGSSTTSLMELTKVYSLFPRLGKKIEPVFLTTIVDRDGKVLESPQTRATAAETAAKSAPAAAAESPVSSSQPQVPATPPGVEFPKYPNAAEPDRVMDPRVAYVMTHLMTEVVSFGTGAEAKQLGRAAAGKTGTTNDYVDAWFMGFTPNVMTGVWVGFDTNRPIGQGETGAHAALPIWLSYMREAVKNYPDEEFSVPPGVVFADIHAATGKLAPPKATNAIHEAFIAGTEPKEVYDPKSGAGSSTSDFLKEDIQ